MTPPSTEVSTTPQGRTIDTAAPRIGTAPDSWGVWNADDDAQPPAEQYLREVAEAGYEWTELGPYGYLGTDPARLRDQFDAHGLRLSGATAFTSLHRSAHAVDEQWDSIRSVAELAVALGSSHLIVIPELWSRDADGHVACARTYSDAEWTTLCAGHDELGRRLLDVYGLRQQFHSHADSPVGTRSEVVRLVEGTDPAYLNLCLDTGHYAYYHGDSVGLIEEMPERIGYLHLKAVDPTIRDEALKNDVDFATAVRRGVMVEPPAGDPDLHAVLDAAAHRIPGVFAIVEQDMYPVGDFSKPLPIATRTLRHLRACGTFARVR